jgi:TatD DNase family protein
MIDSHCHLNLRHFEDDREAALARAATDGVVAFMNIGYDRESLRDTMELVERYPFVFGAAGVHPHDASAFNEDLERDIRQALDHPRIVAVGEIGLDFYRDLTPRNVQQDIFRRMIRLARERHKPIVIHCRDAFHEVIETLISEGGTYRGIFHAFSAGEAEARSVFELGFHVGIGGVVTYRNSRLSEVVATLPLDRIVTETDSPYLTPHPWRGKRNEPSFVGHVVRAIARARGISPIEVERVTTENYFHAMGIPAEILPRPVYKIDDTLYIQGVSAQPADLDPFAAGDAVEAVLGGLADPLENMEHALSLADRAKERGWRVRLHTPGLANNAAGRDVTKDLAGRVDEIVVPFFGVTARAHDELAYPALAAEGWEIVRDFVRCSVASGIEATCEFIATPGFQPEPCRELARELGARYDIRMYRS